MKCNCGSDDLRWVRPFTTCDLVCFGCGRIGTKFINQTGTLWLWEKETTKELK